MKIIPKNRLTRNLALIKSGLSKRKDAKMTYYVTAHIDSKSLLIAKEARVTCRTTADMIAKSWEADGFHVTRREEF